VKTTSKELEPIIKTIELYQESHSILDIQKIKQVFHPKAHIVGFYRDKEEPFIASRDQYLERMAKRKTSSSSLNEPSYTKVLSLDKTDNTAVVKVESMMAGNQYISYLSMLKIDDNWRIINGLFTENRKVKL